MRSLGDWIRLEGAVTFTARNMVATGFEGTALDARGNVAAWLAAGGSSLRNAILHGNGNAGAQLAGGIESYVEYEDVDPRLWNVRYGAIPDPRPRMGSAALRADRAALAPADGARPWEQGRYRGAFGERNWLEEWTFFGAELDCDTRRVGGPPPLQSRAGSHGQAGIPANRTAAPAARLRSPQAPP